METTMKQTRTILALFFAVFALPMAAIGQDEQASNDEAIEDIVVVGQKSMGHLRREVYQAEEAFYSLYNDLNDDRDYDVNCFYEKPTGTNIKNHVCRARFISEAYSAHAARNRNDMTRMANQDANPALVQKTAKFQEKLETLIASDPELQAALIRYNTARAVFFAEREEKSSN
jgi:hypothetical protein